MNLLITGVASGIGQAVVRQFIRCGHTVYGIDLMKTDNHGDYYGFTADITDETSLQNVRQYLLERNIVLDAVLNVAGIHIMASLVESDYAQMKKVVDVNLSGTMLVNRVFYDCLSKRGRIVIVTSEVASFDPMPFNGLYNVTKTALDTYAQALRQELNLLNYKVITIRPGAFNTNLSRSSLVQTRELMDKTKLYSKQSHKFYNLVKKFMGKPSDPKKICNIYYKALTKKRPKLVYKKHINKLLVLLSVLPKRMQLFIIKRLLK